MIKIIGLGNESGDISVRGYKELKAAKNVFLRSAKLKSAAFLDEEQIAYRAFDELFESAESFSDLEDKIYAELENKSGVYLVDGSGFEDRVAKRLIGSGKATVIPSAAKGAFMCAYGKTCGRTLALSAYEYISERRFHLSQKSDVVIYDIDSDYVAAEVKRKLSEEFSDEEEIYFYSGKKAEPIKLYELDRQKRYDYRTAVLIGACDLLHKKTFDLEDAVELVKLLRDENGCPWDRAQTHKTIRANCIEEAYEVAEAIDLESKEKLQEELGDLLLQSLLNAEIAENDDEFDIRDVLTELVGKLIFRHSHIFGKDKAKDAVEALSTWETNKRVEKGQATVADSIAEIASTLPAVMRAEKMQKKAAKANFDFEKIEDVYGKVAEELEEVKNADVDELEGEIGDLLFAAVNVARWKKVEAEVALTASNRKFERRFKLLEEECARRGLDMTKLSVEALDEIYVQIKNK